MGKIMPLLDLPNDYYELPKGKLANIVTCLEMLAKPARPLKLWQDDVALQVADPVNLETYRVAFRAVGQDIMWFSRLIMADEKLRGILSNPKIDSYILKRGTETLGLLELNFEGETDCELAFFGLIPGVIGSGLGRVLMDEAIRQAWAKPIKRLWVHTCTFDAPQALPFYVRSGFTPYTRMIEIHDDPRNTGNLPKTASPNVPIIAP
jgi:GNAT superfamily N-acetyltransferase